MVYSPHILITGASGAIGPRIVHTVHQAGYQIRTFSLDVPSADIFPQTVEVLLGDITDKDAVQSAMKGIDAVIHMAALLHIVNPPPGLREKYERINIGGTSTVINTAIRENVKRVVLFSTIAVYGQADESIINEQSPTHPDTFYAQTKLSAEKIVLDAKASDGQSLGTVLRLGAVYGSHIKGNYERLTRALARHRFIPIGNGLNRRTLVYDKDIGRAAVLAVSHPAAAGRIFNVTDGECHTLNEIISTLCQALGRTPPRLSLPVVPVRFVAGIVEDMIRIVNLQPPIMRATIDKYTEDVAVDSRRIQNELGFVPQYDLASGWKDAIQEMRRAGSL